MSNDSSFKKELRELINRYSKENGSNTPDFILADYLIDCLKAFDKAKDQDTKWHNPEEEHGKFMAGDHD